MQKLGWIYQKAQCQGPRVQNDGKTFFGLHLYLAGNVTKISKEPGALPNVNPARAIT